VSDFEPAQLPDGEKQHLCEELLREFGVTAWRETGKGELIHSCPIPGAHANGDRNPSASLNYKKLTFNCFGCGSRGGLLWFLATCRGEGAEGVRAWLEGATGTGGQVMDTARLLEILEAYEQPSAKPPPIPRYSEHVLKPWTWDFMHPYMTHPEYRGCPEETCWKFKVCYAEQYPMGPNRPSQERIVLPLFWRGELVGWQARRLDEDDEPKYTFSPDFPRDRTVYGLHGLARAVVVESPLSVLRHHHHVPEILSTFGSQVTETQQRALHRYDDLVLWFDNDAAGWKATERVGAALQDFVNVWAVDSPYDADPADLDDETTEELIARAVPFSIWERPSELVPV
jgi:hypothetical protein